MFFQRAVAARSAAVRVAVSFEGETKVVARGTPFLRVPSR